MSLEAGAPAPEIDTTPAAPTPEVAEKVATETPADKAQRDEDSLDDDLRKAFRRATKGETERDETGKFKSKEAPKLPDAKLPADSQKSEAKPDQKPDSPKPDTKPLTPAVAAPNAWKAEDKAKFATLPPDVQKIVADREAQVHKEISDLGQSKKALDDITKVMEPHRARIGSTPPSQYVSQLFQADADLTRDPVGFIKRIADHYKIDMNSMVSDPYAVADPQSAQLQHSLSAANARIEQLERMIGEVGQRVSGREQTEQQARASESERMIAEFSADKPDFFDLKTEIDFAVDAIQKANPSMAPKEVLREAYERAQWANPTTRKAILEKQTKDAEAKRLDEARVAAEKARRAGSINVRGSQQPVNGVTSVDDDLRGVWRRLHTA